jgi:competence protein ComFC
LSIPLPASFGPGIPTRPFSSLFLRLERDLSNRYTSSQRLGTKIGLPVYPNGIARVKETPELKNVYTYDERLRLLESAHRVEVSIVRGQRVLLFDDLYRSGATMNAITTSLYDEGAVADVYALALTRTRSRA